MTTSDMLRYTRIPPPRIWTDPRCRVWHAHSGFFRDQTGDQGRTGSGFRHLDCAERYRNEAAVGEAIKEALTAGTLLREDLFVTTKLWNSNHRPERVKPAFDGSRRRLQLDHIDCYIIHTPFRLSTRRRAGPEG